MSKFEFIRDVTDVLVTSKNKEDPNKNEGARVATTLNIAFSHRQGQITLVNNRIWLKFELIRNVIAILVTSKYEEDPIKVEGARVATIKNIDFSNTKGQLTPQSEVGSGRNSKSSDMLRMSLLLLRIKKIRIKMKALEWPQH